ncbi:hypothetical protein DITRI_Ditri09bG0097000 [Diplodiscus trichospermus]
MVNILWGDSGAMYIRPTGTNLFIVQFPNSETRDRVLKSGPWHIQNKPLIIRKQEPSLKTLEFNMAKLPVWVQLSNIPLEFFTQRGISYIAKLDAKLEVPKMIDVVLRDGSIGQKSEKPGSFNRFEILNSFIGDEETEKDRMTIAPRQTRAASFNLIAATNQSISYMVDFDSKQFLLSAIYGSNEGVERRSLWAHLNSLSGSYSQIPWILARDFNVIACPSESSSYIGSHPHGYIKDFSECLHQIAILDHVASGPKFTWSNKQQENYIAKKLDRVLINELSFSEFSLPKPFKFFNYWANHPEFLDTVLFSW